MRLRRICYRDGGKPSEVVEKIRGDGASIGSQETTKQKVEKGDWKLFVGSSDNRGCSWSGICVMEYGDESNLRGGEIITFYTRELNEWTDDWMNDATAFNDTYVLPPVLKRSPSVALEGRAICSRSCIFGRLTEAGPWRGCRSLCLRSTCCWLGALSSEGRHTPVDV